MDSVIMQIESGAGGDEASDWAGMLLRMYARWVECAGRELKVLDRQDGEGCGVRRATFAISGDGAYEVLRGEAGVHRLVRVSPFDGEGRRHTSFAAVWVWGEPADADMAGMIDIQSDDLEIRTWRPSGLGGGDLRSPAVRIRHIPTGIVVDASGEISQHKNKAAALRILRARLYGRMAVGGGEIGEDVVRSYVFDPYECVKDHRTGMESGDVACVLDGGIDVFLGARS